jgi:hypothetical protein
MRGAPDGAQAWLRSIQMNRDVTRPKLSPKTCKRSASAVLRAVKILHTIAWLFFAGCILALP